jgi:hypothetical protein
MDTLIGTALQLYPWSISRTNNISSLWTSGDEKQPEFSAVKRICFSKNLFCFISYNFAVTGIEI